ncbi:unnamed protein product [Caenorhabditis brenneri]
MEEEQSLILKCLFSAVFNNLDIVEKILEGVTDDIRSNMELRLVNQTFYDACHLNLRKTHRNLKIEYMKGRDNYCSFRRVPVTTDRIYINQCPIKISNLDNYFHFLKDIAKVKIHSIVVKGIWQLARSIRRSLHESIRLSLIKNGGDSLKKLIGMDEICNGHCDDCLLIAEQCVEYGPLQTRNLRKSFTKPRVFQKLIVPDYLLDDIANVCMESTQSKDDCLKSVYDLIPSNISCKTLILKISEERKAWMNPEWNNGIRKRMRKYPMPDHQPMPREDPYVNIKESDPKFKIKEIFVDLTDSLECNTHLGRSYLYPVRQQSYVHLPSKIRRVFLNDKLKIQFSHYFIGNYAKISKVVDGMMNIINTEAPENLEVEILNMYLTWKTVIDYFDELSKKPHERPVVFNGFSISELPNKINISHKTLKQEDQPLVKEEWVGRRFQLINKKRNCIIKWTMFENDHLLDKSQ